MARPISGPHPQPSFMLGYLQSQLEVSTKLTVADWNAAAAAAREEDARVRADFTERRRYANG